MHHMTQESTAGKYPGKTHTTWALLCVCRSTSQQPKVKNQSTCPNNRRTEIVVWSCILLYGNENEQTRAISNNLDEFYKQQWEKMTEEYIQQDLISLEFETEKIKLSIRDAFTGGKNIDKSKSQASVILGRIVTRRGHRELLRVWQYSVS